MDPDGAASGPVGSTGRGGELRPGRRVGPQRSTLFVAHNLERIAVALISPSA
jgi:hypothetical protein